MSNNDPYHSRGKRKSREEGTRKKRNPSIDSNTNRPQRRVKRPRANNDITPSSIAAANTVSEKWSDIIDKLTEESKAKKKGHLKEDREMKDGVFRYTTGCKVPSNVIKVEIVEGITCIPERKFFFCDSLVEVRLPSTITSIGNDAFRGCVKLETINLPRGLISIGKGAFGSCFRLEKELVLPTTLEAIGRGAFSNCRKLESVIIPNKITAIDASTFFNCQSLTTVTLHPYFKSLGKEAFANCVSLNEIKNIPSTIISINKLCFKNCLRLELMEEFIPTDVKDTLAENQKNPWSSSNMRKLREHKTKEGPGAKNGFEGATQRQYGPEYWTITDQQLESFKKHPLCYRTNENSLKSAVLKLMKKSKGSQVEEFYDRRDKNGKKDFTMREFVELEVIYQTKGLQIGLGLLFNQIDPKLAHVMVSHAWDEPVPEFVEALQDAKIGGPYWICSSAIFQNNDNQHGLTIKDQLGKNPEFGPFATVLRSVKVMVAILTSTCNIYTRLWCVYEMYLARKLGVKVVLSPYGGGYQHYGKWLDRNVCIASAHEKVDSIRARCGHPSQSRNDDELRIRSVIKQSPRGFAAVDEAVEMIRFEYLIHYDTNTIKYWKTNGRDILRQAIETIMTRLPKNRKLKNFDRFLDRELGQRPGFEKVPEEKTFGGDHDYYIMQKDQHEAKVDVYELWVKLLQQGVDEINNSKT